SPDNTELLKQAIEDDRFEISCAGDGEETLAQIQRVVPDVLLLDIMMPKIDGFEVLKRLRASSATENLPVIIVSARSDVQDVVQGLSLGANDYVTKPFHPDIVKARVLLHYNSKLSRDELQRVSRLKDEFLSIASHDLQTPVSTIIGYCQWLMDQQDGLRLEAQLNCVRRVYRNALFMHELINDLLDVVRLEAGRMRLYREQTSIAAVLTEAIDRNSFAASDKDIHLSSEVCPDLPTVVADPLKLQQVLNNLISNGIKFSHPGARVTVRARCAEAGVEISVIDTGQGIPPEEQGKLFTKFSRLSVRATKGEKSTGLGLLISKKIIDLHGGRITVESQVDRGSTFTFFLPLRPPATADT
ncbi:MAG: response regulator, partial [Candidatus Riflebacteria bacterium]|nr:response regulator [Candidatus Riflebacteria bacterium]